MGEAWPPEKIKALRKSLGVSTNDLAVMVGYEGNAPGRMIRFLEADDRVPSGSVKRLFTLLDRDPTILDDWRPQRPLAKKAASAKT